MARAATASLGASPSSRSQGFSFDRLLVSLGLLLLAGASAAVFLVATGILPAHQVIADEAMRERLLSGATGRYRVVVAAVSGLVGMGFALLTVRRVGGSRKATASDDTKSAGYVLVDDAQGTVVVEPLAVATLAKSALRRVTGLVDASVSVAGSSAGPVRVRVQAQLMDGSDLQQAGSEIQRSARHAVEHLSGLEVQDVSVRLDVLQPNEVEVMTL